MAGYRQRVVSVPTAQYEVCGFFFLVHVFMVGFCIECLWPEYHLDCQCVLNVYGQRITWIVSAKLVMAGAKDRRAIWLMVF